MRLPGQTSAGNKQRTPRDGTCANEILVRSMSAIMVCAASPRRHVSTLTVSEFYRLGVQLQTLCVFNHMRGHDAFVHPPMINPQCARPGSMLKLVGWAVELNLLCRSTFHASPVSLTGTAVLLTVICISNMQSTPSLRGELHRQQLGWHCFQLAVSASHSSEMQFQSSDYAPSWQHCGPSVLRGLCCISWG